MATDSSSSSSVSIPIDDEFVQAVERITGDAPAPAAAGEQQQKSETDTPTAPPANNDSAAPDPVEVWKAQVEDARRAEAVARAERDQAARAAMKYAEDAWRNAARAQHTEYDLIVNAITSHKAQLDALEQQAQAAFETGDARTYAKLTGQMATVAARVTQLEDGEAEMRRRAEAMRSQAAQRAQQPPAASPQRRQPTFDDAIRHFDGKTQAWLRKHPEYVVEPARQEAARTAHYVAKHEGLEPASDAYFARVEEILGMREARTPRRSLPAAPVSRGTSAGGRSPSQIELSVEEQNFARRRGMSNEQYARNKARAIAEGKFDMFSQRIN